MKIRSVEGDTLPSLPVGFERFVESQRVARLATADGSGQPYLVPVCFVYPQGKFFIVVDQKPKRVAPLQLKRVRNILENANVALLMDRYGEEWDKLAYLLVFGRAEISQVGIERDTALGVLKEKYPQYRAMDLSRAPVVAITPERYAAWGSP